MNAIKGFHKAFQKYFAHVPNNQDAPRLEAEAFRAGWIAAKGGDPNDPLALSSAPQVAKRTLCGFLGPDSKEN